MGLPSWRAVVAGAVARIAREVRIAKAKTRATAATAEQPCAVCGMGLVPVVPGQVPVSVREAENCTPSGGISPCPACGRSSAGGR
jgi:hypothetical protein